MEGELLMKTFRQILVIARTEFRFAFRRGAPVVVTAIIGLIVSAGILLEPLSNLSQMPKTLSMTPEQVARLATIGLTPSEWAVFVQNMMADMFVASTVMAWLLIFTALLLLPVATSGSIPADRKFGVSEILRSTPITGSIYLAGKILGMLTAVLLVGALMLALFFTVTEIILFSSLHYWLNANASWFLIKIALMDGLPMLVWGTTIGMLVGIFFRTRRAAIFPGFLAGVASLVGWAFVFRAPAQGFFGITDIAYFYLVQNYHSPALALESRLGGGDVNMFNIAGAPQVGIGQLALMYSTVVVTLALLIILARLWFQWKENF
jgi:ABC-2 family transporter protein